MKRIFTLLALVMVTVFATADTRTYKGTWCSKPGDFADYEGSVVVSQDASGNYTLVFDRVVFGNDDLGQLTFSGLSEIEWAGNGAFDFAQEGGNLVMGSTYFELGNYDGNSKITDDEFHVTFRYFSYNGTEYRNVYFDGKRTSSGGSGNPDEPTISSTEQFTADVSSVLSGSETDVYTDDVTANLCEWTDGSFSINLASVNTEQGLLQNLTFKGLTKTEDGEDVVYSGLVTPEIETLPAYYQSFQNLQANVYAIVDEDGDLLASVALTDANDPTFELVIRYGVEVEPADPIVVNGTLSGYTKNDDGEFTNTASSVLTIVPSATSNLCDVTLTNVALPSASISLGTVTIKDVDMDVLETTTGGTATLTKQGGECATTSDHPLYTSVDLTSFEMNYAWDDIDDEEADEDMKTTACTATLVIDNWGETVTYTFTFDPTTAVRNIVAADGTVKRVYTLTGATVNGMQRGVNIVRTADGKTMKVLKK